MRPDTAPAGSRMTASVTESQTSSVPRWIGTSRPRLPAHDREAAVQDVLDRAAERVGAGDAGDPLGGSVPEDDVRVAVDGDDAVGDVREDRVAALAVDGDRREELRVRERGRRVRRERLERLDLVGSATCARAARRRDSTPWTVPSGPTSGTPRYAR